MRKYILFILLFNVSCVKKTFIDSPINGMRISLYNDLHYVYEVQVNNTYNTFKFYGCSIPFLAGLDTITPIRFNVKIPKGLIKIIPGDYNRFTFLLKDGEILEIAIHDKKIEKQNTYILPDEVIEYSTYFQNYSKLRISKKRKHFLFYKGNAEILLVNFLKDDINKVIPLLESIEIKP